MKSILVGSMGFALARPATAQNAWQLQNEGRTDMRAMASVTIPLGAKRNSQNSAPRFDLMMENSVWRARSSGELMAVNRRFAIDPQRQTVHATRLSLTFERNPKLLLNGERVATYGPRLTADDESESEGGGGISTGGWVAIGLGAFGGLILASSLELADELNDLSDPD